MFSRISQSSSEESMLRINSWLRYWVVLAALSLPEMVLDKINILPHYNLVKTSFIIWCLVPGPFSGTDLIFLQVRLQYLSTLGPDNVLVNLNSGFISYSAVLELYWTAIQPTNKNLRIPVLEKHEFLHSKDFEETKTIEGI